MTETKKTTLHAVSSSFTDILILFISFAVSLNVRRFTDSPPSQTYGVENASAINPESNYIAIILILISTAALYLLLKRLLSINKSAFRLIIIGLLSLSFLIGVIAPGVARYENNVDTFHHGEQLAPAIAFENNKKPYVDLFTLRGAGEDVITPWISLKLFGESIGSYYLLTGLLQLVAVAVFFLLINSLFKKNLEFLLVSLWFTSTIYDGFYYIRDIFVWVSVALVVSIIESTRRQNLKLYLLGLLAGLALFYSFDRGIFLSILLGIVLFVSLVFEKKNDLYLVSKRPIIKRVIPAVYGVGGYLTSLLVGIILLKPTGFVSFLQTTFGEAAKYQGLIFNTPYSKLGPDTFIDWLPIITMLGLGLVIFRTVKAERSRLTSQTLIEVMLLLFSIIFFRAASGRPDIGHIAYGTPILFLLLFIVVFRRIDLLKSARSKLRPTMSLGLLPLVPIIFAVFSTSVTDYYRLPLMNQAPLESLRTFISSPHKQDSYWETDKVEAVTKYIQDITNDNDCLFVLSSDPIFYFTTKLQNPTRFSISWFADADPLEYELLQDLRGNPPKVILYESGTYYDRPDFIPMKDRLPEVNSWILANYPHAVEVSGAVIRTR